MIALGDGVSVAWDATQVYRTQIAMQGVATPHAPIAMGVSPSMLAVADGVAVAWTGADNETYVARFCP